ncbi:hypothetical protein BH18CHL2_BH18CHL2_10820 [soil metagenome]
MADAKGITGVTRVRVDQAAARLLLRYDSAITDERSLLTAVQAIVDRLD